MKNKKQEKAKNEKKLYVAYSMKIYPNFENKKIIGYFTNKEKAIFAIYKELETDARCHYPHCNYKREYNLVVGSLNYDKLSYFTNRMEVSYRYGENNEIVEKYVFTVETREFNTSYGTDI